VPPSVDQKYARCERQFLKARIADGEVRESVSVIPGFPQSAEVKPAITGEYALDFIAWDALAKPHPLAIPFANGLEVPGFRRNRSTALAARPWLSGVDKLLAVVRGHVGVINANANALAFHCDILRA
jgi:hypothetical protein